MYYFDSFKFIAVKLDGHKFSILSEERITLVGVTGAYP